GAALAQICPASNYIGAAWTDDDMIYFIQDFPSGLMRVPAAGGRPEEVVKLNFDKGERQHRDPCHIFGTKSVLFTTALADNTTFDEARIAGFSAETKQVKVLLEGGSNPRVSPSGHLLYARDAKVFAIRFDATKMKVSGQPFQVLDGVLMSRNSGCANFDVSAS